MFDIFTEPAKQAIMAGQDEAIALGHDFMGTEHLLLGLLAASDSTAGRVLADQGVTAEQVRAEVVTQLTAAGITATHGRDSAEALATIGIDVNEIRRRADDTFGPGEFMYPRPAYTAEAKSAIERSVAQAHELGLDWVGSAHMLLGVLDESAGFGARALAATGADLVALRQRTLDQASSPPA